MKQKSQQSNMLRNCCWCGPMKKSYWEIVSKVITLKRQSCCICVLQRKCLERVLLLGTARPAEGSSTISRSKMACNGVVMQGEVCKTIGSYSLQYVFFVNILECLQWITWIYITSCGKCCFRVRTFNFCQTFWTQICHKTCICIHCISWLYKCINITLTVRKGKKKYKTALSLD